MTMLLKRFVKDYQNTGDETVRESYGKLSGTTGILCNVLVSGLKLAAGFLSGSVAVMADAANNLSDAASSVITIVSFHMAGKPADAEHPFGHQRIEYIASLIVAFIILFLAVQLGISSVDKILHPELIPFQWLTAGVLVFSIAVKAWMFWFNRKLGKMIRSTMLAATAADSISDVMATSAVLLSTIVSPVIGFSMDGYMGMIVAGLIAYAGIKVLLETSAKILGQAPTPEQVHFVEQHIKGSPGVLGMHDLMLHSYGEGRIFASVHVEVDANEDILVSHDRIDNIEREIAVDHGIHLVIHMDPIVTDDEKTNTQREAVKQLLLGIDERLTMHDFRMVEGPTHTNLIFDVVVPPKFSIPEKELQGRIIKGVHELDPEYYAVVTIDATYTGTPSNKLH